MADERQMVTIRLRKSQIRRLALLQAALEDKMKKKMSRDALIETIIDDFLESR